MEAAAPVLKARRRPVQQRSRLTCDAILEAFVRLLLEKGYARLTMRDIALVAGVGLGTLYEYFPGKQSMAAYCIHQRFAGVGVHMQACSAAHAGRTVAEMGAAVLDSLLDWHARRCDEWSALILLERQISDLPAYRALYRRIVALWHEAFAQCSDRAHYPQLDAQLVHAAVYGVLYQTLMLEPERLHAPEFRRQLGQLLQGYLQNARACPESDGA